MCSAGGLIDDSPTVARYINFFFFSLESHRIASQPGLADERRDSYYHIAYDALFRRETSGARLEALRGPVLGVGCREIDASSSQSTENQNDTAGMEPRCDSRAP